MAHLEKFGAASRSDRQMASFQDSLEDCQLSDLGFTGSKYTWCNNRTDHNFTKDVWTEQLPIEAGASSSDMLMCWFWLIEIPTIALYILNLGVFAGIIASGAFSLSLKPSGW